MTSVTVPDKKQTSAIHEITVGRSGCTASQQESLDRLFVCGWPRQSGRALPLGLKLPGKKTVISTYANSYSAWRNRKFHAAIHRNYGRIQIVHVSEVDFWLVSDVTVNKTSSVSAAEEYFSHENSLIQTNLNMLWHLSTGVSIALVLVLFTSFPWMVLLFFAFSFHFGQR